MERSSDKKSSSSSSGASSTNEDEKNNNVLNLKETELRLGLPGLGVSLFGKDLEDKTKKFVSRAKRGSDAIDGSEKWVFSVNGGSEVDLGKADPFFSPRVGKNCLENSNNTQSCCPHGPSMKEVPLPHPRSVQEKNTQVSPVNQHGSASAAKAQVVGWPPIRSFRKNTMATKKCDDDDDDDEGKSGSGCLYVKVSMDGAPYLRKVDLKTYSNYIELSSALEKMFSCFTIGQCSSHGLPGRDGLNESHLMDLLHGWL